MRTRCKNKSRIYFSVYLVEVDFNQHEKVNKQPDEDLHLEVKLTAVNF